MHLFVTWAFDQTSGRWWVCLFFKWYWVHPLDEILKSYSKDNCYHMLCGCFFLVCEEELHLGILVVNFDERKRFSCIFYFFYNLWWYRIHRSINKFRLNEFQTKQYISVSSELIGNFDDVIPSFLLWDGEWGNHRDKELHEQKENGSKQLEEIRGTKYHDYQPPPPFLTQIPKNQ